MVTADSQPAPDSIARLIAELGGPTKFGQACGFADNPAPRAADFRRRNSIPGSYWSAIVAYAREHKIPGVTLERLAALHKKVECVS
jgi:hypothetical protein